MSKSTSRTTRKTAGETAKKAIEDNTKYDKLEVAHGMAEEIYKELLKSIETYEPHIDQEEFCAVYINAADPLIPNLIRRKYYCWPFLPSPRPDQGVFLYNKKLGRITKRLWVLPQPMTMAELASSDIVTMAKPYQNMREWCVAFYKGTFWEFIRYQHDIKMLSQQEYQELHPELFESDENSVDADITETFDFSKITASHV